METIKNKLRHYGETITDTDTIEESAVVIVPDTSPDVLQIISNKASVYLQEKSCTDGTMKIAGNVNCRIAYLSTEGREPYVVPVSIPFSFTKEIAGMEEGDKLFCSVKLLNAGAAMANPRKLSVKVQLGITEVLFKLHTLEYAETIAASQEEAVNCLNRTHSISPVTDIIEKRIVLNDEIRLTDDTLNENCVILRSEASWINEDVRTLPNKIMIRGRVDVTAVAINEAGNYLGKKKYSVPFSQIVDCDGLNEGDEVIVTYIPAREDIEVFTGGDETTGINFSLAATTQCVVKRDMHLDVLQDAYSTKWNMTLTPVPLKTITSETKRVSIPVRETLNLESSAEKILDIAIVGDSAKIKAGESSVGGNFFISVLYQCADGSILSGYKKAYIEGVSPSVFAQNGAYQAFAENAECVVLTDGEAEVSFDGVFLCTFAHSEPTNIIADCVIDMETEKQAKTDASLVIKTIEHADSVWNIAKEYNTTPAVITHANKLDMNEDIPTGKLVIIPFVNR